MTGLYKERMGIKTKDKKEASAVHLYVGSRIDDADLTPAQFRVLCRIVRRGKCTESISNIAKGTKIGIHQCRRAIRELVQNNWIRRTDKKGRGIVLEATIHEALPITNKLDATPDQPVRGPLTDELREPVTDKLDKGDNNKELLLNIFNNYPRRVKKREALIEIEKALKKESYEFLLKKTKEYATSRRAEDNNFTPFPSNWFKDERYHDEIQRFRTFENYMPKL